YRRNPDFSVATHEGFGLRQATMLKGRRNSTATAFLRPASGRRNLTVITGALVRRVIFEGKRATGIEFERNGVTQTVTAVKEVVRSAGVLGTPQLLMLSGVGPAEELKGLGI